MNSKSLNQNQSDSMQADQRTWSFGIRRTVSIFIMGWLILVVLGPLSNPISSQHFSQPLAESVAPLHQAFFLDHGYRFFAPDPTASHLLTFKGTRKDGSEFSGQIPDRNSHWPRLLYHRWFMVSETLFAENYLKPSQSAFELREKEYKVRLESLLVSNERGLHRKLTEERKREKALFETARARTDLLTKAIAKVIMQRHDAESIQLFVREREIPFPEQVQLGLGLDDESLLSQPLKIGELDDGGFRSFDLQPQTETIDSEEIQ